MNYMTFKASQGLTIAEIQSFIHGLDLSTYTNGDILVHFDANIISFSYKGIETSFFIKESEYGGYEVSSQEGFVFFDDHLRYFFLMTFEYLASRCGADVIDSDGAGEILPEYWTLNKRQPNDSIVDYVKGVDKRYPGIFGWVRTARHFFEQKATWLNSPTPF